MLIVVFLHHQSMSGPVSVLFFPSTFFVSHNKSPAPNPPQSAVLYRQKGQPESSTIKRRARSLSSSKVQSHSGEAHPSLLLCVSIILCCCASVCVCVCVCVWVCVCVCVFACMLETERAENSEIFRFCVIMKGGVGGGGVVH